MKSQLLQEEQRSQQRIECSIGIKEESAFVPYHHYFSWGGRNDKNSRKCNHFSLTIYSSDQCLIKQHHLKADYNKRYATRGKASISKITAQISHPDSDFCMIEYVT